MTTHNLGPDLSGLRIQREAERDVPARRGPWRGLAVAVVIVAAAAWAGATVFRQAPEVEVTLPTVTQSNLGNEILTATGYVVSRHQANVGGKVLGRVVQVLADEGQKVKTGQSLAVLDQGELPAQLDAIRVQLPQARNELKRQEALTARGLTTQKDLDAARTIVSTLEAQARVIEAEMEQYVIRAPFDGTITLKNLELGETISPTGFTNASSADRGFRIADMAQLEVEADVNENQIASLHNGQDAQVELEGLPGKIMAGRLRMIQPTANRQKATVMAKVTILQPDAQVRPDMTAKVTFLKEAGDVVPAAPRVYVPRDAVIQRGSESGVWVVEGKVVRWVPLQTGQVSDGQVEVVHGLKGDETVVRSGGANLKNGSHVREKKASS